MGLCQKKCQTPNARCSNARADLKKAEAKGNAEKIGEGHAKLTEALRVKSPILRKS